MLVGHIVTDTTLKFYGDFKELSALKHQFDRDNQDAQVSRARQRSVSAESRSLSFVAAPKDKPQEVADGMKYKLTLQPDCLTVEARSWHSIRTVAFMYDIPVDDKRHSDETTLSAC